MRSHHQSVWMLAAVLACSVPPAWADGPGDNSYENVRRVPKLGVEVSDADRAELEAGLKTLAEKLAPLQRLHPDHQYVDFVPDVEIFHRAVDQALRYQEFFDAKEIPVAKKLLQIGMERAELLMQGKPQWLQQTGLVVRGYRSKIDHTVQPYGLIIPENYFNETNRPRRLDLWFHGRGETLSEVNFIQGRLNSKGEFTPPDTIVLHPYGRYCNANKFAGEIDTFEALESASKSYKIDPQRIGVRGFSMGGAACWQFAVHYPGKWFAANPGAGFSETPDFLKVFQNETLTPTWFEQKLWRWYDCTGYAANLAFLPTVAYSGDMDKQKQAADIMEISLKGEGLPLLHIIGPMTGHKIHPDSKIEIERTMSRWARLGAPQDLQSPYPVDADGWETIEQFQTYTLRYNQSRWITILGLQEHWEPARIVVKRKTEGTTDLVRIITKNVDRFELKMPARRRTIISDIDGQPLGNTGRIPGSAFPITSNQPAVIQMDDGRWFLGGNRTRTTQRKVPGLQGPIDDAFLDSFIFVKPTGKGISPEVDAWVAAEFEHAVTHWRQQMRGDARVKLDSEVTKEDMESAHVVLWGDPRSNDVLAHLFEKLPLTWTADLAQIKTGNATFDAQKHLPLLIAPNPLNPERYVVLNSSFTYREYDYLNNARQTPKLPDWVVVDITTKPNARWPGKIVDADFFNEEWQFRPRMKQQSAAE